MILETKVKKIVRTEGYNYEFRKTDGYFARWGTSLGDNPTYSPIGPEILDIEISTNGCPNNCPFCYKNNTNATPTNMTLNTFKTIIDKTIVAYELELENGKKVSVSPEQEVKLISGLYKKVKDLSLGDDISL